jgi:hypothetical protein
LLGGFFPKLFTAGLWFYALAAVANGLFYGVLSAWLFASRGRRPIARLAPVALPFFLWALYLALEG